MKAMILAAGVGSRLDPLTRATPKPLVPIVNKPNIVHIIEMLARHSVTEIMVNLHYLGDQIRNSLGDGSKWGVKLSYSEEERLWGDAGSVKLVEDFFDDTFLVIGGDDLADFDLSRILRTHKEKKALCTIALSLVEDPSEYGIALLNDKGRVTRFLEKPKGEVIFSNAANTGVYFLEREVLDLIPRGVPYGFGRDLLPLLLERKMRLYGILTSAYWRDIGNLKEYRQTHNDVLDGRLSVKPHYKEVKKFVWMGKDVEIDETATIEYPVVIGNNCRIEAGATVAEYSVLADGAVVESGATVRQSVLWPEAAVMRDTCIERCVVGRACRVKSNASLFDGVIVTPRA
ncbi:MAG: NDP-sugar synthase [Armatimonadetes bacterium]|nr:NDP-sugar synthase [Armatimonadota bacterium]